MVGSVPYYHTNIRRNGGCNKNTLCSHAPHKKDLFKIVFFQIFIFIFKNHIFTQSFCHRICSRFRIIGSHIFNKSGTGRIMQFNYLKGVEEPNKVQTLQSNFTSEKFKYCSENFLIVLLLFQDHCVAEKF